MSPARWGILLLLLALMGRVQAAEQRLGLFIGQNQGPRSQPRLVYAESDARRIQSLMAQQGGIPSGALLLDTSRGRVLSALRGLKSQVAQLKQKGDTVSVVVYFSGHASSEHLLINEEKVAYTELKGALEALDADLTLLVLDACHSGTATTARGGSLAPAFLVEVKDTGTFKGSVVIASSAAGELSHESERLGGGYFTHYLMAGLMGAADESSDGQVTLEEAYQYAYHHTLLASASTVEGLQHPAFEARLRGQGSLVLTRQQQGQTVLRFPSSLDGQYVVFDQTRRQFVAELKLDGQQEKRLSLPVGRYLVQKRTPDSVLAAELTLTRGSTRTVEDGQLLRTGTAGTSLKKGGDWPVARSSSRLQVSPTLGYVEFLLQPDGPELFQSTQLLGVDFNWRGLLGPGWSLSIRGELGQRQSVLQFDPYPVATAYQQWLISVGAVKRRPWGPLDWLAGVRLTGLYVRRSFPNGEQPFQDFGTLLPGIQLGIDWPLSDRVVLGAQGVGHFLYYDVGEESRSMSAIEGQVRAGWTF